MMESRFLWHRCSCCFQVITIAVMVVAIFSGYAKAQGAPSVGQLDLSDLKPGTFRNDGSMSVDGNIASGPASLADSGSGNPETAPSDSQGNQGDPSAGKLRPSDLKVGVFCGGGSMKVHRDLARGPAGSNYAIPTWPAFPASMHRAKTRLNDAFGAVEWGFRWSDILEGTTSFDTNIGIQNHFKQNSTVPSGQNPGWAWNYALGSVLQLPENTNGVIKLDNKNRIFNVDQCFAFPKEIALSASPMVPKLRFLAGWKYSLISSDIDPSFAAYAPLERHSLPGTSGWVNSWRNAIPFTTGFTMDQRFWWTGPYVGMRLAGPILQKLSGRWYVEGKAVPYAFGNYKFDWKGAYEDGFFFFRGRETTDMAVHGYFLEIKGGTEVKLIETLLGALFLDVWSKYSYLNMHGSGHEAQSSQNNFLAVQNIFQDADQRIGINEHFWGVGVNLVLHF